MLAVCPHCGTKNPVTFRQADSGKPIYCRKCKQDIHSQGWDPEKKGDQK